MKVVRWLSVAAAACGLLAFAVPGFAATTALSAGDRQFVDKALEANAAALGRAQTVESSSDNYVLDYAEAILSDRQAANRELAAIGQAADYHSSAAVRPQAIVPPTPRPGNATAEANEKKLKTGYSPVAYFETEVRANREVVSLYQRESAGGADASLREYAKKFVPKMQGELTQSQHLLHVEMGLTSHR